MSFRGYDLIMNSDWDVRPCGEACSKCQNSFGDGEKYVTSLLLREDTYERTDYCERCWEDPKEDGASVRSIWRGLYRPLPPPAEEILKKETAESLLRRLMERADESQREVIYVLAVMLERKRQLVERDKRDRGDGTVVLVFEHRQTGETFMIPDVSLHLDELQNVQTEIADLLGPSGRHGASESTDGQSEVVTEADAEVVSEE